MKRLPTAALLLLACVPALAQQGETASSTEKTQLAQVSFHFDRPGLTVPKFTLTVYEDGSGSYEADQVLPAQPGPDTPVMQHIDRKVSLSRATTARIFSTALALDRFNAKCASNAKNIADTGNKTLRYSGPDGDGGCVYNYSQDKRVTALTDLFLGVAATLDIGRKLDFDHRFDRLGLDATTASLVKEVEAGRVVELGTIATTLKAIAEDSEVLERVRLRAAKLLRQAQPSALTRLRPEQL